jgi:hypothetical protein
MMIDCDACAARGPACDDCVVTVLLGAPPAVRPGNREAGFDLDSHEQAALAILARSGLVPPLRLVAAYTNGPVTGESLPDHHHPAHHDSDPHNPDRRKDGGTRRTAV